MKVLIRLIIIAILALIISIAAQRVAKAQEPPGQPKSMTTVNAAVPETVPIPIDGGLGFLLAAGIAYAGKRLYNTRKTNE